MSNLNQIRKNNLFKLNENISSIIKEGINESSLSRVYDHLTNYDICIITAFKDFLNGCAINNENNNPNIPLTKEENIERNNKLKSSLLYLGYGVTKVDGTFIYNFGKIDSNETREESFLVVNLNNDINFVKNLIKLGELFCQDSILLKEKGSENAYLYGTNRSGVTGYHNKSDVGKFKPGRESEFMTKVSGRSFYFESLNSYNNNSKHIISENCKNILNELRK